MDGKERRRFPRVEGEFQVDLLNMGDDPGVSPFEAIIVGTALDLSRTGIRLRIQYRVSVGTKLSAIVYYKGRESICLCDVVWERHHDGQSMYGLFVKEWSKLDSHLDRRLAELETDTPALSDRPSNWFSRASAS